MAPTNRQTKAEVKRARAAAARAAAERAQRRARLLRVGLWSAVAAAALVAAVIVVVNQTGNAKTAGAAASPTAPGASTAVGAAPSASSVANGSAPPWPAPADPSAAVAAAGLSMLSEEGTALHIHTHLDVFVDGSPVQVPADIGIDEARPAISALHTHDTTGVIHVESPSKTATFTLGQFFTEWQVPLSADRLGGLTVDATHHLKVYVNGTLRAGDPAAIVLAAHDEIAVIYGTDAQNVNVPMSYRWTNGL
jgi:hypothetical protein